MKQLFLKLTATALVSTLAACGQSAKVSDNMPYFGGAENGGIDVQVGCARPSIEGRGCVTMARTATGEIHKLDSILGDTVAGRAVIATVPAATGAVINGLAAVAIAKEYKKDSCSDCGGSGGAVAQVILGSGAVTSASNAGSNSTSGATAGAPAHAGVPLGTMD